MKARRAISVCDIFTVVRGRNDELREADIVEADDGEILGDVHTALITFAERADGGHIIRTHHGGGTFGKGQDAVHRSHAAFDGVVPFDQVLGKDAQADFFHGVHEGSLASHRRFEGERSGNKSDAFVVERG